MIGREYTASILYAFALQIKISAILFLPGFLLTGVFCYGLLKTFTLFGLILHIQLILAIPFLISNPYVYIGYAYNFTRKFDHEAQTVWQITSELIFDSLEF
jgi:alpha-1,3-mannosyltransferase